MSIIQEGKRMSLAVVLAVLCVLQLHQVCIIMLLILAMPSWVNFKPEVLAGE